MIGAVFSMLGTSFFGGGSDWLAWAIGAGVLMMSGAFACLGRLAMRAEPAVEAGPAPVVKAEPKAPMNPADARVFTALARRCRLNKAQRQAVRMLADESGTPAQALFISEYAFDAAVARVRASDEQSPQLGALETVRSRLFAE